MAVPKQVVLDVGHVECREVLAALRHQGANRGHRVRAAQVADDRNDQVLPFERPHELKITLRCQVVPLASVAISREQQVAIGRVEGARPSSASLELEREPGLDEHRMEPRDRLAIAGRQRHAEASEGGVHPAVERAHGLVDRLGGVNVGDDPLEARVAPRLDAIGHRPAGQHAEILGAIPRLGEQRLEQQVQQQVVAAQIDDERDGRANGGDVREVLIGSDADVGAAARAGGLQRGNDLEVRLLVRDQIVGVEFALRFRELLDARSERGLWRRGADAAQGRRRRRDNTDRKRDRADREFYRQMASSAYSFQLTAFGPPADS